MYILDIPEESPSVSHIEPSRVSERNTPLNSETVDLSDSEILQSIKTQSSEPPRVSSSTPIVRFSSCLSDLDSKLAALQNIADHLEKDFSNSGMVENVLYLYYLYF